MEEVQDMLPDGIDTESNYLKTIVDSMNKQCVGFMWYLYENTDGIQQSFLCDFVIREPERRKGYAIKALTATEHNASEYGCQECVLFVAKENKAAINLYAKCGYSFLRELDEGMYLRKLFRMIKMDRNTNIYVHSYILIKYLIKK